MRRLRPFALGGAVEDGRHLLAAGIVDDQLEEEAVELGLGQRIGAFLLDRVLRGHDEERLFQLVDRAADGDAVLLHRLQQGRLRLRRGPVDFVGQDDLGEDRAGLEAEDALAVGRFADDVGADDVGGHQVGRELDAVELQVEHLAQRAHQQGLAQAGDAFEQRVPADEQAGQHAVDDVGVADDDLADLGLHSLVGLAEAVGPFLHRCGG